ncbi:UvrD-helicase domain-containing protein [Thorsellia anophelis]|uniref:DNA helicase-4 n=1 Tax=Thorsellia anophelis DSM 18579 TaxID=1123402 RepID=A0A1I0DTC2_9GAMM|nr:UvrD-helicase domain-containing protein [Thorsellia anophelis]SET35541.1 DNA helicase-4 [Thorsellia anophelis DSM 18579]
MILKATLLGKHLAQHPFHQIQLLDAGVELSGPKETRIIAFNQIVSFSCKRGLIWGEIEFILSHENAISLHGTEWQATVQFYDQLVINWQEWSKDILVHATKHLEKQILSINALSNRDCWLPQKEFIRLAKELDNTYESLPFPEERIGEFKALSELDYLLQQWQHEGIERWHEHNNEWAIKIRHTHANFFERFPFILDPSQFYVVLQQEPSMLVLGSAGSGKSTALIARASWLLYQHELALDTLQPLFLPLLPDDILLMAADSPSKQRLELIRRTFNDRTVNQLDLKTPYELAFYLLKQTSKKTLNLFSLLNDTEEREKWLLQTWQHLCSTKKPFAKLWRNWLSNQYEWEIIAGDFWLEPDIAIRMGARLDRWLKHLRFEKANKTANDALIVLEKSKQSHSSAAHEASQQSDINEKNELAVANDIPDHALLAPDEAQVIAERKLFAPLLKAWKDKIKSEQAIDEPDALIQALKAVGRAKFVTPWRHILIDTYQEFSLLARLLLKGLKEKSAGGHFLYCADDAQILTVGQTPAGIDELIEEAKLKPEENVVYELEHDYRLSPDIRKLTDTFINQNPNQQIKPYLVIDDKPSKLGAFAVKLMAPKHQNAIYTSPDINVLDLLDKLSGFAPKSSQVLFTAQYLYQIPEIIISLKSRWPHLNFIFKPFNQLHGVESDFTFVFGLQQFGDSFPAFIRDTALEKHLLPIMESFLDAEMRRWMYVAMTRAKYSTWLLHDIEKPSIFINELNGYGAKQIK